MLYDNALLVIAYLEAYQITGRSRHARVAKEVLSYILRDMTAPEGGFYSAEDADSEGEEGKFYTWSRRGQLFCDLYNITEGGNFEGQNIPNLIHAAGDEEDRAASEDERRLLFVRREERVHPHKDDKILSGWNGLMIGAMARAYAILGDPSYLQAARQAMAFILEKMRREDGRLLARYRAGEALYPAYAADYSFLVWALIELYQATFETSFLHMAMELNDDLINYFWDEDKGGLFFYGKDGEELLARPKEAYDGAVPSANSVAALNFMKLGRLTGKIELEAKAYELIEIFGQGINQQPSSFAFFLVSALFALKPSREIAITADVDLPSTTQMISEIQQAFLPDTIVVVKGQEQETDCFASYIREMPESGETTAYICENHACRQPITEMTELRSVIAGDKSGRN